ncbi:sek-1, partial [Pristionchus pacificus]
NFSEFSDASGSIDEKGRENTQQGASTSKPLSSTMNNGMKRRPGKIEMPVAEEVPTLDLDDKCKIRLDDESEEFEIKATELKKVGDLGRGAYGVVESMIHQPTGTIMAVKRIESSVNDESQKRMLVELHACMKSDCCPQMVRFYGAMYREGDVWLCMEVMDISLDKFYRRAFFHKIKIPEYFLAKLGLTVVEGLNFMKEQMNLMHRDVKPSNILLNSGGQLKICDFGISGHLTNSVAKTVGAGCKPYMPPERIDGDSKMAYDVRADVWSLGITMIEVATGTHPYAKWKTPFDQLKQVVGSPSPRLPDGFSEQFNHFVNRCLEKDYNRRPKYPELLANPFLEQARHRVPDFSMSGYVRSILELPDPPGSR